MSKNQTFIVELSFNETVVGDDKIMEIAQNVERAIVDETNGQGIAPIANDDDDNESGGFLEIVRVTPQYLNKTVIEHVF
jgi:hypothetical protein